MRSSRQVCRQLRLEDHTLTEIVAKTGLAKATVYTHIHDLPLSPKKRAAIAERNRQTALALAAKRKGISKRPFRRLEAWSDDVVLLISHLMFDGEVLRKRCVYNNRNDTLLRRVEKLMRLCYDYPPKVYVAHVSGVTRLRYNNVALAQHLYEKAQELLVVVPTLPRSMQREFLRAFFDDEGCMDFRPRNNKRRIRGYQKDKNILHLVKGLLENFSIEARVCEPNEVMISGKENLLKFQKEVGFSAGVSLNPNRTNSLWKLPLEKRELLTRAIESFKK